MIHRKLLLQFFLSGAVFILATNSHAAEIQERDFQFEDSILIFRNDLTFVVGKVNTY